MVLVAFALWVFMQAVPAPVDGPPISPPASQQGAPPPGPSQPRAPAPAPGPVLPEEKASGQWVYDVAGLAAGHFVDDEFSAVNNQIWGVPAPILYSRQPENTADQPQAAQLNDQLVEALIPGLLMGAMALVAATNILGMATGSEPDPLKVIGGFIALGLAALGAVHNRELQDRAIDLVNTILGAINGATIRTFAEPGMHVSKLVAPMVGAIHGLVYLFVLLFLTVVLFMEAAWVIVLGALIGLLILGSFTPFVDGPSRALISKWAGSLFSPVIVVTALKLGTPTIGTLKDAPDLLVQLFQIAFLAVAWQAPGVVAGAISVKFPGVSSVYYAGRLTGIGRFSERMIRKGGGNEGGGRELGDGADQIRQEPPVRTNRVSGKVSGSGGGTAATGKG